MKKTYITPCISVVSVRVQPVLTGASQTMVINTDESEVVTTPDEIESRRHHSVWDDEEEFEENE